MLSPILDQALLVNSPINNSIKTNHDDIPQELSNDETIHLNERCSTVLRNELPQKEKDPGCFTLPYLIGSFNMCNESRERDNRIEKMMKKFVDNTVSYSQNSR